MWMEMLYRMIPLLMGRIRLAIKAQAQDVPSATKVAKEEKVVKVLVTQQELTCSANEYP